MLARKRTGEVRPGVFVFLRVERESLPVEANMFEIESTRRVKLLKQEKSIRGDFSSLSVITIISHRSSPQSYLTIFAFSSFLHLIFLVWFLRWRIALL